MEGFSVTRVATTAATDITPCRYITAHLSAGAANASVSIYNGATTAAASKILELSALASSNDDVSWPVRVHSNTARIVLSVNSAEAFVGSA